MVACGAAIVAPFQIFLLAWAVLGPLHYLAEISWLHDRNFRTPEFGAPFLAALIYLVFAAGCGRHFCARLAERHGSVLNSVAGSFLFQWFSELCRGSKLVGDDRPRVFVYGSFHPAWRAEE